MVPMFLLLGLAHRGREGKGNKGIVLSGTTLSGSVFILYCKTSTGRNDGLMGS